MKQSEHFVVWGQNRSVVLQAEVEKAQATGAKLIDLGQPEGLSKAKEVLRNRQGTRANVPMSPIAIMAQDPNLLGDEILAFCEAVALRGQRFNLRLLASFPSCKDIPNRILENAWALIRPAH